MQTLLIRSTLQLRLQSSIVASRGRHQSTLVPPLGTLVSGWDAWNDVPNSPTTTAHGISFLLRLFFFTFPFQLLGVETSFVTAAAHEEQKILQKIGGG